VTREFRRGATKEERARLLECAYAVAAADGSISSVENVECGRIAEELGFTREEALAMRSAFRDKLSVLQKG
jgi:tellurite resistance protein